MLRISKLLPSGNRKLTIIGSQQDFDRLQALLEEAFASLSPEEREAVERLITTGATDLEMRDAGYCY